MGYRKIFFIIPLFFIPLLILPNLAYSESNYESHLPYWHYNDAKWWSQGKISDEKFLTSIIIILDESGNLKNSGENQIPSWFSTVTTWFSNYKINHNEYQLIIEYLHSQNILKLSEPLISNTLHDFRFKTFPLIQTFEKDVTLFKVGNYLKDKLFSNDGKNFKFLDIQFILKPENTLRYESLRNSSNSVVISPTLTYSAYAEPGFYTYYRGECDEFCLTTSINYGKPLDYTSSTLGLNILHMLDYHIITDIDVDQNPKILEKYDKIIVLHNEYVTKKMFESLTNHPNVVYLYPNALYAEVEIDYEGESITLIRGHDYPPDDPVSNGFDWKHDNTHYENDIKCIDWKFKEIPNGYMLNCYPEYAMYSDELLLKTLNEL